MGLETFPNEETAAWLTCIYHFQTLIGGVLALFAAGATILFLHRQKRDEIKRKHRMLRAGLPSALAEISDYAVSCVKVIWRTKKTDGETGSLEPQSIELPNYPADAFRNVQAVIEAEIEERNWRALAKLLRFSQVQHSRMKGHFAACLRPHQRDRRVYSDLTDALILHAATERLFDYGSLDSDCPANWPEASRIYVTFSRLVTEDEGGAWVEDDKFKKYLDEDCQRVIDHSF